MRSDAGGAYKQRDLERGFSLSATRDTLRTGVSTSGGERNHVFMNVQGADFVEVSGVSGLDSVADGRAFAWLDYDRDGMLDIAVVNANAPLLQLFRNQLPARGVLALDLVGGNDEATATSEWSPRDATGARVTVHTGAGPIVRELHAGEGFAAQNSRTLHVGLGDERVERVAIRWPSGRRTVLDADSTDLAPGSRVTVFEDPQRPPQTRRATRDLTPSLTRAHAPEHIRAYVTTATWCGSCTSSYPDLRRLMSSFTRDELEVFAVPTGEPARVLEAHWERHNPPHELLNAERHSIVATVLAEAGSALPWTVLMDETGAVRASFAGVPTLSRIQELLDASHAE
ncbi:MAG: ASPIC/UnbV domain-containing protein [Myxococcales bacterium]|nr:ASPIC/UnbV domain-containing protein [Myxococcales bacterium]